MKYGLNYLRIFIFLVLFTITMPMSQVIGAPAKGKLNHAENAYNAGMAAYNNEEFQKAVYAFQNSIGYDKKLYKSYYMLGMALFMNNESQAAEDSLLSTINSFPKEWKAQALLAEYYAGQKNYELAEIYYQKTIDSPTISTREKRLYQEKMDTLLAERAELWRVPENEKEKILNQFKIPIDMKEWRVVTVEKQGNKIHLAYLPKDEDLIGNKWKTMIDVACEPAKLGGFAQVNQSLADQFYKQGATMDTLEQAGESRVFETKIVGKPTIYILGRLFKSSIGYCTTKVIKQKNRFKEKEVSEWVDKLKLITISPYKDSAL